MLIHVTYNHCFGNINVGKMQNKGTPCILDVESISHKWYYLNSKL